MADDKVVVIENREQLEELKKTFNERWQAKFEELAKVANTAEQNAARHKAKLLDIQMALKDVGAFLSAATKAVDSVLEKGDTDAAD